MKRPAIQLYFGDWLRNAKLRRCSWGARGVLIEVMALMHDSDEYGTLRWQLDEIAQAVGAPPSFLRELATKGVLKGGDKQVPAYRWAPSHGGKRGSEVVLVEEQPGPLWYSSRMVRDEYKRTKRGIGTRFGPGGKLPTAPPNPTPSASPTQREGDGEGGETGPPIRREGGGSAVAVALPSMEGSSNSQGRRARDPVDNPEHVNGRDSHPHRAKTPPPGMTAKQAADQALGQAFGMPPQAGEPPDAYHARLMAEKSRRKPGGGHAH